MCKQMKEHFYNSEECQLNKKKSCSKIKVFILVDDIDEDTNYTMLKILFIMRQKKHMIKDLFQICIQMRIMKHPTNAIKKLDLKLEEVYVR